MPIETYNLSEEQSNIILKYEESHYGDLKSIDISPKKLTESISAFANADGGELYIGIDEDKATNNRIWRGFLNQEAANAHIQIFESIFPLGKDFQYSFLSCASKNGLVLHIELKKTRDIRCASDGIPRLRRGAQNLKINTPQALRQLEYVKGLSSFETEILNLPIEIISNSLPIIEFMLAVIPSSEPISWLAKQILVRDDRPTVAGVLLFAEEPQALLPKRCGIKIYRYRTKDLEGSRETLAFEPITIEGHLYRQIISAVETTSHIIEDIGRLGQEGIENVSYPQETLHEIITNAVLHRDYNIADDIHIRIFDNRVEVQSPGVLPAHITPENILDERFARNGVIVRLINKFPNPPNKDVGEGLNTAFAAMHKMGLKEPIIENLENCVLVKIRHEVLASPEKIILEYLETHETIRNKEAREICHVQADYVIKEIFRKLSERNLIEKVPGTRTSATSYRKGSRFTDWR